MKIHKQLHCKSALSVLLSLCMIFSCVSVGFIATDAAQIEGGSVGDSITKVNRVKFHANLTGYNDSGNALSAWNDWSLSAADSNHYYYTFYTAANQNEKEFGWHAGGSDWGDNWYTMNGEKFGGQQSEKEKEFSSTSTNDRLSTIASDSGWVKVQIDWYGAYGSSSYVKFYQTAVSQLTSSVSVGNSSLISNETTTITASSSGGTGSSTNSIKVLQGSASGTDVTASVLSGTTFTAPEVDSATTYYVVNVATDSKIGSYSVTSTAATITVNPDTTPKILTFTVGGAASATIKLGETAALASTTKNDGGNSVTYSSSDSTKVSIVDGNKVKALAPCQDVTITARLTGAEDKTVTVSVLTPSLSFSYSPNSVYVNGYSTEAPAAPTANNVPDGTTISDISYSITSGSEYATIDTSTGVVTSKTTAGTVTVRVSGTVTYNSVSYAGALGETTVTVKQRESVYFKYTQSSGTAAKSLDGTQMTYDDALGKYKLDVSLGSSGNWYIVIYDSGEGHNLSYNNGTLSETLHTASQGFQIYSTDNDINNPLHIVAELTGTYRFYFDAVNNELFVECPHTVTFDTNDHSITAPAQQIVTYGGTATSPTITDTGYRFDGWCTDEAGTTPFNFSTAITTNTTLFAKWTKNQYSITYPAQAAQVGYSISNETASPVYYADPVSFTVTPATGYRIKEVKYIYTTDNSEHTPSQSGTTYSFTMPASSVTVSVTAVQIYTVKLVTQTENLSGASINDIGFDTKTYKIDNGQASSYTTDLTVDKDSVVTFDVTYSPGYQFCSVSPNATASNSNQTFTTAAITADTTVTVTAIETTRTVHVKRRFTNADDTTTENDSDIETLSVGITTSVTVAAVPDQDAKLPYESYADAYEFHRFTLPANGHIIPDPAPNGRNSFTIVMSENADQSEYTIYIDYKEILHTLTLVVTPQGSGSIQQNNVTKTSVQVGNVTGVTLAPVSMTGYKFARWEQQGSFSTAAPVVSEQNPNPSYLVKIGANSTLTAVFEEISYTVKLVQIIYKIDGENVLAKIEEIFLHVGRYTPITVSAPRVANSQFLNFALDDKIVLGQGYSETDSTIEITATDDATLTAKYISLGNITIYIDMNDNVGTPILNFKYFTDKAGNPVPYTSYDETTYEPVTPTYHDDSTNSDVTATVSNLPFEMELVTGSESVYKYTVKLTKLRDDYKIGQHTSGGATITDWLKISYITVENRKIGEGYLIDKVANTTGEMWLKADSTNLKGFHTISYKSVTNTFIGLIDDGSNSGEHALLRSAINTVHGTAIHTDDDEIYHAQYAGLYRIGDSLVNDFHYTMNVKVNSQVKQDNTTYYFDRWVKCLSSNLTKNVNGTYSFSNITEMNLPSGDLNILQAPEASAGDQSYIAVYKPVTENSSVHVQITYHFNDYDTSDGNFVFDPHTDPQTHAFTKVVPATYTKTVSTALTAYPDLQQYDAAAVAVSNLPYIKSNYFDYSFVSANVTAVSETEADNLAAEKLILVDAYLKETAREYTIVFKNDETTTNKTGYYQNTEVLAAPEGYQNPVWKMKVEPTDGENSATKWVVVGTGATYNARYISQGGNANSGLNDCLVIKLENGSGSIVTNRSDVYNSYTEHYYSGDTEMLRHNFYIIDYCAEGKLVGGGVLYATTDSSGNYRQTSAANNLDTAAHREEFIAPILGSDFETEYKAQTISNIGFRYKPFSEKEDVYRYSDELDAYLTMFEGTNVNSANYEGQKLRLFSFMVYDNDGINVIVSSEGYAEVSRYIPQS